MKFCDDVFGYRSTGSESLICAVLGTRFLGGEGDFRMNGRNIVSTMPHYPPRAVQQIFGRVTRAYVTASVSGGSNNARLKPLLYYSV